MSERRPSTSELHLQRLEDQEEKERCEERGIFELFEERFDGADEPLERDSDG